MALIPSPAKRRITAVIDWLIRGQGLRAIAEDWLPWAIAGSYKLGAPLMGLWAGWEWSSAPIGIAVAVTIFAAGYSMRAARRANPTVLPQPSGSEPRSAVLSPPVSSIHSPEGEQSQALMQALAKSQELRSELDQAKKDIVRNNGKIHRLQSAARLLSITLITLSNWTLCATSWVRLLSWRMPSRSAI